jgi:ferritin-like metal-binding protein YciE
MEKGRDFLRAQVNNAVAQHKAFVDSMNDHARQAQDVRFRDLCNRHLSEMMKHQTMLEDYQRSLGGNGEGTAKKVLATLANAGKDLVDAARQDDFLRLVGDVVMARQAEDTFKAFRDAGRELGEMELARIGEQGERGMDRYVEAANRLVRDMFVECAQEVPVAVR